MKHKIVIPHNFTNKKIIKEYLNWFKGELKDIPLKYIDQHLIDEIDKTFSVSQKKLQLHFKQLWLQIKKNFKKQ